MQEIILDGLEMINKQDIHIYLKEKLKNKEYYGNNLDALFDILETWNEPVKIILLNTDAVIENLGSYGREIINVFQEASVLNKHITFKIK